MTNRQAANPQGGGEIRGADHTAASLENGVLRLTLTRPEKKNALTGAMYLDLADRLTAADADDAVRAALIVGSGGVFTAGNDLGDFLNRPGAPKTDAPGDGGPKTDAPEADDREAAERRAVAVRDEPAARFVRALAAFGKPLVAGVEGHAVGIGSTMLLHCDFAFAAPNARFQFPFVNLALAHEAGASLLLPQRAGRLAAAELLMLGDPFDAVRAQKIGLIGEIVADPIAAAAACAARLAEKPGRALRTVKRLLRDAQAETLNRVVDMEFSAFFDLLESPEAREVFTAFLEKRKPDFSKTG